MPIPRNIALVVIGCNYTGSRYALGGCINDAMDFAKTIVNLAEIDNINVRLKLFLDSNGSSYPSKINIINTLRSVINSTNKGTYDAFIFYFAGHGIQYNDRNSDEKDGKDESILAADGKPILDDELFLLISRLRRGKEATFVFDCCHSGSILDLPKVPIGGGSSQAGRMSVQGKVACFSACSESGKSIEKRGRGLFTSSLCSLLRKRGINSKITPILRTVKNYLESQHSNMTVTVSCSNQIAIRKSSIVDLRTVGNGINKNKNKNKNKIRGINNKRILEYKNLNQTNARSKDSENCYISPYNKPKNSTMNPTINTTISKNPYLKNCQASFTIPWKPKALRNLRNRSYV